VISPADESDYSSFMAVQPYALLTGLYSLSVTFCTITHLTPLTTVGTYIIRDMVKAEIRNRQLVEKQTSLSENADIWDGLLIGEEAQAVDAAIKLLSPEDQEILRLRFILELSYKDIQDYYLKQRDTSTSIPALRKRLARAAQRLRNKFIEMYWG
jgi:DNA-directed RNA polymerase specialized sigma24 family protein